MSDASKSDEQVAAVRRETAQSGGGPSGPRYTGPERTVERPTAAIAAAARRAHEELQARREATG